MLNLLTFFFIVHQIFPKGWLTICSCPETSCAPKRYQQMETVFKKMITFFEDSLNTCGSHKWSQFFILPNHYCSKIIIWGIARFIGITIFQRFKFGSYLPSHSPRALIGDFRYAPRSFIPGAGYVALRVYRV